MLPGCGKNHTNLSAGSPFEVRCHVKNLYDCRCGQIWKLATCLCFSLKLGPVGWGCYLDSDCT